MNIIHVDHKGSNIDVFGDMKTVAIYGVVSPRQNIDILCDLYDQLKINDLNVQFFCKSEAIPRVAEILKTSTIFVLDDPSIFSQLTYIDLLITHDYAIWPDMIPYFKGKLMLFPHNAGSCAPTSSCPYGDFYLQSPSVKLWHIYDYTYIPNLLKYHGENKECAYIIPMINMKTYSLMEESKQINSNEKRYITYYPIWTDAVFPNRRNKIPAYYSELTTLIERILSDYPQYTFVFRPFSQDLASEDVQQIIQKFSGKKNFIFDNGSDNRYYLLRSKFFITDYSSVAEHIPMANAEPVIKFMHQHKAPAMEIGDYDYKCHSVSHVLAALEHQRLHYDEWKEKLSLLRQRYASMPDPLSQLVANIIQILRGEINSNWQRLEKGDTPCKSLKEFLILLKYYRRTDPVPSCYLNLLLEWSDYYFNHPKKDLCMLRTCFDLDDRLARPFNLYVMVGIRRAVKKIVDRIPADLKNRFYKYRFIHHRNTYSFGHFCGCVNDFSHFSSRQLRD